MIGKIYHLCMRKKLILRYKINRSHAMDTPQFKQCMEEDGHSSLSWSVAYIEVIQCLLIIPRDTTMIISPQYCNISLFKELSTYIKFLNLAEFFLVAFNGSFNNPGSSSTLARTSLNIWVSKIYDMYRWWIIYNR